MTAQSDQHIPRGYSERLHLWSMLSWSILRCYSIIIKIRKHAKNGVSFGSQMRAEVHVHATSMC